MQNSMKLKFHEFEGQHFKIRFFAQNLSIFKADL